MGTQNSKTDSKHKVAQYDPKVELLRIVDDPNYGRVKLVREDGSQNQMIMKEFNYDTKQSYEKEAQFFESRVVLDHPNIVKVIGYNAKDSSKYCSTFYKVAVFIEILTRDLETDLKEKARRNSPYTEGEVLVLAYNMISILSYLQEYNISHGDVRPLNIFVQSQNYILTDPKLEVDKNSNGLIKAVINKSKTLLSPELLVLAAQGKFEHQHNVYKSDVFSLGATLLSIATLTNSEDLYDYQTGVLNQGLLNERLAIVNKQFSKFTYNLIHDMLTLEEERRPDFKQLDQLLAPYVEAISNKEPIIEGRQVELQSRGAAGEREKKAAALPSQGSKRNMLQSHALESDDDDQIIASERTQQKTDRNNASLLSNPQQTVPSHQQQQHQQNDVLLKKFSFNTEELEEQIRKAIERSQQTFKIVSQMNAEDDARRSRPESKAASRQDIGERKYTNTSAHNEPSRQDIGERKYTNTSAHNEPIVTPITITENRPYSVYTPAPQGLTSERSVKSSAPEVIVTNTTTTAQPNAAAGSDGVSDLVSEILKKYQTPSTGNQQYTTATYTTTTYNVGGTDTYHPVETSYKPSYEVTNIETRPQQSTPSYGYAYEPSHVEQEKRTYSTYAEPQYKPYDYTSDIQSRPYATTTGNYGLSVTGEKPLKSSGTELKKEYSNPFEVVHTATSYEMKKSAHALNPPTSNYQAADYTYSGSASDEVSRILAELKKSQGNQNAFGTTTYGESYTVKPIETYSYSTTVTTGNAGKTGNVIEDAESALSRYTPTLKEGGNVY